MSQQDPTLTSYDLDPEETALDFDADQDADGEAGRPTERLVAVSSLPRGVAVSTAKRGASAFQDRLVEANAAARDASLERLAGWFPGYDWEVAAQTMDDRRFVVLNLGGDLIDHLQGPAAIERILTTHQFHQGEISFAHGDEKGHQPPPPGAVRGTGQRGRRFRIDVGGLVGELADDWTAIINGADRFDTALSDVCDDLTRALGSRINTNCYIAWDQAEGFGAHWDNHDTIIVPIHGTKHWEAFEPAVLSASRPWVSGDISERALWSGPIEPGMCLVIPRGWGHLVTGSDELSIHYTIGTNRLRVHQMIERVAHEAGFWPLLRADVPQDLGGEVMSYGGSVFDEASGLGRALAEIATPELIDRAVATYRARIPIRQHPSLRATFRAAALGDWDRAALRMRPPAGVLMVAERDDSVVVAFGEQAVRVRSAAVDAFVALAAGEPLTLDDLPAVSVDGVDVRADLARELVTAGLAAVVEVH